MIEKSPDAPDNIFQLDRYQSFGDYARAYGDELARRYEDYQILYFPLFPLKIDLALLNALAIPDNFAKIGITNGIENPIFVRDNNVIKFDADHLLLKLFGQSELAGYMQSQIRTVNDQIREGLRTILPKYFSLAAGNITWRMTETRDGGMYIDFWNQGRAASSKESSLHRIKLFLNIDKEPRQWRTSLSIPEIMARYRSELPAKIPVDRNSFAAMIAPMEFLQRMPSHKIAYPTMSAILVNAEAVAHEVIWGRRLIAGEFLCEGRDMLDPAKLTQSQMPNWLAKYGYEAAAA